MVSLVTVVLLIAAAYVGLTFYLRSRAAFLAGVAVTLGFWIAPLVLSPSYANALYFILGLIGSVWFGLAGVAAWWRLRKADEARDPLWLVGSGLAIVPVVLWGSYQFFR
jgi:hypothetical protein